MFKLLKIAPHSSGEAKRVACVRVCRGHGINNWWRWDEKLQLARSLARPQGYFCCKRKKERDRKSVSQIVHKQIKTNGNAKVKIECCRHATRRDVTPTRRGHTRLYMKKWMRWQSSSALLFAVWFRLWSASSTILRAFQASHVPPLSDQGTTLSATPQAALRM